LFFKGIKLSNFKFLEQAIWAISQEHDNPVFFEKAIAAIHAEENRIEAFSHELQRFSAFMEEKTGEGLSDISFLPVAYNFSATGKTIFEFNMPIFFTHASMDYTFDYQVYLMKEGRRSFEHDAFLSLEAPFGRYWVSSMDSVEILKDMKRKAYPFLTIGANPWLVSHLEETHYDVLKYIEGYLKNLGLHSEHFPVPAKIEDLVYDEGKDLAYFQHEFKAHTETQLKFKNKEPHPRYNEAELIVPYPGFRNIDQEPIIVSVPFDLKISYIKQSSIDINFYALLYYFSQPNTARLVQQKALALPVNHLLST
jgi:hypothetical protein